MTPEQAEGTRDPITNEECTRQQMDSVLAKWIQKDGERNAKQKNKSITPSRPWNIGDLVRIMIPHTKRQKVTIKFPWIGRISDTRYDNTSVKVVWGDQLPRERRKERRAHCGITKEC